MSWHSYDRMSAHDAGYLTRETDTQPLHYVLQLDVSGRLTFDEVRDFVAGRLDRVPLAHRRPLWPLLTGRPVWVDDHAFTVDRVVTDLGRAVGTRGDTDAVLRQLTGRRLPRDRPLWNLTVASGPGDGTTLWLSVHHSMMDGGLLTTLLGELFPPGRVSPDGAPSWRPRRAPSRLWLLLLVLLRAVKGSLTRRRTTPAPLGQEHPTTLTGPVSAERSLADTTVRLAAVNAARKRTGTTVNDVFLAVATEALRDYLPEVPETVLALVPRNVRRSDEHDKIGNRGASMLVPLPTGRDDPGERMLRITRSTAAGKQLTDTAGTQGWRFDVALTNVPLGGPHGLDGRPVVGLRASVPLQGQNRLVGVLTTHDDDLTISWTADGAVYPDLERLAALTAASLTRFAAPAREVV